MILVSLQCIYFINSAFPSTICVIRCFLIILLGKLRLLYPSSQNLRDFFRSFFNLIFFYSLFIYFERERVRESVCVHVNRGGTERGERENPKQAPCCQCRANVRLSLMNREIMP